MRTIHLIIVLSLLNLLSIRLYAQDSCKVLKPEISNVYTGKCKEGLANGKGVAEGIDKYEGEFKKGLPHGKGRYTWATGEVYEGKWKEGKKEGEGKFSYRVNAVDSIKRGIWKNDVFVKKIIPPPYKVLESNSVSRYTVRRVDNRNRVLFSILQNGVTNTSITNLLFTPSSGTSCELGAMKGFENIVYPFTCRVTYTTQNSLKTVIFTVQFAIEITEPGDWEITLNN